MWSKLVHFSLLGNTYQRLIRTNRGWNIWISAKPAISINPKFLKAVSWVTWVTTSKRRNSLRQQGLTCASWGSGIRIYHWVLISDTSTTNTHAHQRAGLRQVDSFPSDALKDEATYFYLGRIQALRWLSQKNKKIPYIPLRGIRPFRAVSLMALSIWRVQVTPLNCVLNVIHLQAVNHCHPFTY